MTVMEITIQCTGNVYNQLRTYTSSPAEELKPFQIITNLHFHKESETGRQFWIPKLAPEQIMAEVILGSVLADSVITSPVGPILG